MDGYWNDSAIVYWDIIDMPHHRSQVHPHMSMHARAAQFAPFAALNGHFETIHETARLTDKRIALSVDEQSILDEKLQIVRASVQTDHVFTFTYFVPDDRKDGGAYILNQGKVTKIDEYNSLIYLDCGLKISISDIYDVQGEYFSQFGLDS